MDRSDSLSSKLGKNKAKTSINIGGLVVLGGALAVSSLIAAAAAFAVKRRRRRYKKCKKEVKDLGFTLQNSCLTDGSTGMLSEETQIDSIEVASIESVILEENSASLINGEMENFDGDDQEILITDDPKQEMIIASCGNCCAVEELALPVLDSMPMNEVEDKIQNDYSEENSSWSERIEIKGQEQEVDTERIMEEETKSVSLIEEQKRADGEEEEDEEVLSQELRNTTINMENSGKKIMEEDRSSKTPEFGDFNEAKSNIPNDDTNNHETCKNPKSLEKKEMLELVEVNNQTTGPTSRNIWWKLRDIRYILCKVKKINENFTYLFSFAHQSCTYRLTL
ncbi:cilia- and flagella-associated protein [Salix suchowensis]|nr:cilia- and flagella-associated protein [Salix suchowensis]